MDDAGLDSNGHGFRNAKEMWREEIGLGEREEEDDTSASAAKRHAWYQKGISYWQGVDASVDGVLGGYGHVNDADVNGSESFLKPLLIDRFGSERRHLVALDCGSGIGRVTKNLLLRHFNEVDLLEPVSHFLDTARENLAPEGDMTEEVHMAVNFYCLPLQEFTPEIGRYDVIWIQWCIGHLPDDDFVSFFKRAKVGLKQNGFFVVKENVAKKVPLLVKQYKNVHEFVIGLAHGTLHDIPEDVAVIPFSGFVLDTEDSSITRSDLYFRDLFKQCGLYVHSSKDQKGFPAELFAVKIYALMFNKPKGGRNKKLRYKPALIKEP